MLEFKSLGIIGFPNRNSKEYTVKNPTDCSDWSHLIGQSVKIDDKICVVRSVHAHTTFRHYAGEAIGLLVLDKECAEPGG